MRRWLTGLVLASALMPGPTYAQDAIADSFRLDDARSLVTACTVAADHPLQETARGFCLGYMTGAMQLYRAATQSPNVDNAVCPEGEVSRGRMREVFLDWAAANPTELDEPAVEGLMRAAVATFPCSS